MKRNIAGYAQVRYVLKVIETFKQMQLEDAKQIPKPLSVPSLQLDACKMCKHRQDNKSFDRSFK